ncbi:type IV secretory system conjugative DNA transfer family protein [Dinoroseobacter sp. S76]|uniref:type IV secretory system conjugative DNA transfer family protein n=1 Tax=Dinoroseobacter sp. S76 TaxID=3415124 RepID=UPI003C7C466D
MTYIRTEPASAEWLPAEALQGHEFAFKSGRILLGETKDGTLIGLDDPRHVVTVAGSRAGKTTTSLMSNLRTWTGSVLAIDPKGELATNTAQYRADLGQDVRIFDPFNVVKGDARKWRCGFNPLADIVTADNDNIVDDAAIIADALVPTTNDDKSDHWSLSAKNLLRGLILFLVQSERDGGPPANLENLRKLVSLPYEVKDHSSERTLEDALETMSQMDHLDGAIAAVGGSVLGKPGNERGSIISTAVEHTAFLDSPPLKTHVTKDIGLDSLRRLKTHPLTVYLVLPASRMASHYRWLRVIITQAMAALEAGQLRHRAPPVLFLLEEFPTLGYMRHIEAAAGLMAGYGVKLWTVMQDLSQLKSLYPRSWETFLGNAGILEAFGNVDTTTTEYLSNRMGKTLTRIEQSSTRGLRGQQSGDTDQTESIRYEPLQFPHEISMNFRRATNRKLIISADHDPFSVWRVDWQDSRL